MSMAVRERQGPSESQSIANAKATDRPYLSELWRSRDRRRREPPRNVDALVAWFREQYEMELPERLHGRGLFVGKADRDTPPEQVGGSLLGTPATSGGMRIRTEASAHAKDHEDELIRPLASALAALRREARYGHDLVEAVAYSFFDWRSLIGRPFYRIEHRHGEHGPWCSCSRLRASDVTDTRRTLVMAMPEDVMETLLVAMLTRLWWLLAEREPHIGTVT